MHVPTPASLARLVQSPFQKFLKLEAASGIALLAATLIALVWANSPWAATYETVWSSLRFWVNDGLMTGFFFVVGLVAGKPIGIIAASALAVRLGICRLPTGADWRGVAIVGCLAGIGFTMAIFIAALAFPDARLLAGAKAAILAASLVAGVLGYAIGRISLRR